MKKHLLHFHLGLLSFLLLGFRSGLRQQASETCELFPHTLDRELPLALTVGVLSTPFPNVRTCVHLKPPMTDTVPNTVPLPHTPPTLCASVVLLLALRLPVWYPPHPCPHYLSSYRERMIPSYE